MRSSQAAERRLRGRCIFLSIGEPAELGQALQRRDIQLSLERTVAALGRTLFSAGCRLIMRPDRKYTPMLALLAAEYPSPPVVEGRSVEREPEPAQPAIILARTGDDPSALPSNWAALQRAGMIDGTRGPEQIIPDLRTVISGLHPFAMILAGGWDNMDEEVFRSVAPQSLVIPLGFTGGRAALRHREGGLELRADDIYGRLSSLGAEWAARRRSEAEPFRREPDGEVPDFPAYRPIQTTIQLLVRELIERRLR